MIARGRSHLNVSALIKRVPNDTKVKVIALRHANEESKSAITKFTQFKERGLDDVVCFKLRSYTKYWLL